MSSAGPSASLASVSSTLPSSSTAPSTSAGMPAALAGNSSLPFSFLITFIAIFLFFLGCGLGSRRVTRQLRRNLGLQITPPSPLPSSHVREKPIIWDVYPSYLALPTKSESGGSRVVHGYTWENMAPLCATYVRTPPTTAGGDASACPEPEPPPRRFRWPASFIASRGMMRTIAASPSLARPPPLQLIGQAPPRRTTRNEPEVLWRGHRLPQFIARPLLPPGMQPREDSSGADEPTPSEELPVSALQVSVLIAMPSPETSQARRAREKADECDSESSKKDGGAEIEEFEVSPVEGLGEYTLGFTRMPWAGEIDGWSGGDKGKGLL
ncbi:hypothetical protein C8Q77DRAFT_1220754 [Trametes polyzona]|nr:hypothetical protein C8Q77DRAFT_1220754 [Trametes polyzona]